MPEPISATLASINILKQAFQSINDLYQLHRTVKNAPSDWMLARLKLNGFYSQVSVISEFDVGLLATPLDPFNKERTKQGAQYLQSLKIIFDEAEELLNFDFADPITDSESGNNGSPYQATVNGAVEKLPRKKRFSSLRNFFKPQGDITPPVTANHTQHLQVPKVLNSPEIVGAAQHLEANLTQSSLASKGGWVFKQGEFEKKTKQIEELLAQLGKHFALRTLKNPDKALETDDRFQHWESLSENRLALKKLHFALRGSNQSDVKFDIKLETNYEKTREMMYGAIGHLDLQMDSNLFNLLASPAENSYVTLLAEDVSSDSASSNSPENTDDSYKLESLCEQSPGDTNPQLRGYQKLGKLKAGSHVLYREYGRQWLDPTTLEDILLEEESKAEFQALTRERLKLAVLIAVCYLYPDSFNVDNTIFRALNFRFYRPNGNQHKWKTVKPNGETKLSPWLACSLGSRPPVPADYDINTIEEIQRHRVLELGLLLYQIGRGEFLQYNPDLSEIVRAQSTAYSHPLEANTLGLPYKEIVDTCLSWPRLSDSEDYILEKCALALAKLERELSTPQSVIRF